MATLPPRVLEIDAKLIDDLSAIAQAPDPKNLAVNPREVHGVVVFYKGEPPELFVCKGEQFTKLEEGEDYPPADTKKLMRSDHAGVVLYTDPQGNDPAWWWVGTTRMHS